MGTKEQFIFALTQRGQVYMWGDFSVQVPKEEGNPKTQEQLQPIKILNNLEVQQLSYEGTLYCWGDDSEHKYGVLGLGSQLKALRPCPNSSLFDYMIKSVSTTDTHSCAIDSTGRLFCWGYGPHGELGIENQVQQVSVPTIVTKQKLMTIKKAVVHLSYTVFCTSVGYVFLYGTLHPSASRFQSVEKFGSTKLRTQQSQERGVKDSTSRLNSQNQMSNKPMNVITQVISLSDSFISDIVCGDNFLLCQSSKGELFFVDDALESVQISITPIESVAVAGSRIYGLSQSEGKLFEWSTAGLNKLSFNKENKMLLRQDFNMKQFQLVQEFNKKVKLINFPLLRNSLGLQFEQEEQILQQIETQICGEDLDMIQQLQIPVAKLIVDTKGPQYGSLQESVYSEQEEGCLIQNLQMKEGSIDLQSFVEQPLFLAEEQKQIQQILRGKHDHLPSFRAVEQPHENQFSNPSLFQNDEECRNLFAPKSNHITVREKYQQQSLDSYSQLERNQFNQESSEDEEDDLGMNRPERPIDENIKQFYIDTLQINAESLLMSHNDQGFAYRPSSIKSSNNSNEKSKSFLLFNHNSSPSMKECAEQMHKQFKLNANYENNSPRGELSCPSFLNTSQEMQQALTVKELSNNYQLGYDQPNQQRNHKFVANDLNEDEEERKEDQYKSLQKVDVENLDSSCTPVQISIQRPYIEDDQQYDGSDDQRVELQIIVNPTLDSMNVSQSKNSSREASIIRTTRRINEGIEESMEITIDNMKIQTKRTTTPKRILNNFSQNRRAQSSQNSSNQIQSQSFISNFKQKEASQGSQKSELSDGFNITQNSGSLVDRNSQIQNLNFQFKPEALNFDSSSLLRKQALLQGIISKQSSSGAGSQINSNINQDLALNEQAANQTQIYEISPLKDDSIMQNLNLQQDNYAQQNNQVVEEEGPIRLLPHDQKDLNSSQLNPSQQRYSCLINPYQLNNELQARQSLGRLTNQTEDNFEIEYTISQSQTPESQNLQQDIQKQETNIKRRINFDDASYFENNGCVIRVSDINSETNKLLNSFTLNISQPFKQQPITEKESLTQRQNSQNFYVDQSQSFIFNQSAVSIPQVQPFNDDNLVSNIKSASTPSVNGNTTHIMMLTEEKFKNLKGEISNQAEYSHIPNIQMTAQNFNPSPRIIDFTSTVKPESQSSFRPSNAHHISSFIQHSKYFQVYENFRRGFGIITQILIQNKAFAFKKMLRQFREQKEKQKKLQNFAKLLFILMKQKVNNHNSYAFKRIKKQFKESQLRVYIQQKQKQFAKQASAMLRVESIILGFKHSNLSLALLNINQEASRVMLLQQQRKQQSITQMLEISTNLELRTTQTYFYEFQKQIQLLKMEEQFRFGFMKLKIYHDKKQLRDSFRIFIKNLNIMRRGSFIKKLLQKYEINQKKANFNRFISKVQELKHEQLIIVRKAKALHTVLIHQRNRLIKSSIQKWKKRSQRSKMTFIALQMMTHIYEQQLKFKYFKTYQKFVQSSRMRDQYFRSLKASTLLLYKKLEEIRLNNLRSGFKSILDFSIPHDDTMLVKQSQGALTNLSFTCQNPVEISLILNKRQRAANNNFQNQTDLKDERFAQTQRNLNKNQQQTLQLTTRSNKKGQKQQYGVIGNNQLQYNQQALTNISAFIEQKKPTLNDYLSFTPNSDSNSKPPCNTNFQSKFFNHKRNGATCSNEKSQPKQQFAATQIIKSQERQYLDCPLPIKDYQERQLKKNLSKHDIQTSQDHLLLQKNQSYENLNQLNCAFRHQISRIKERQDEKQNQSIQSSSQNYYNHDQSFDQRINQLQIEITQTPEQFEKDNSHIYQKRLDFENQSKNISPKINPLCASESYQQFRVKQKQSNGFQYQSQEQNGQYYNMSQPTSTKNNKIYNQSKNDFSNPIILSDKINEHIMLTTYEVPQTSTFRDIRDSNDCDSNVEDDEDKLKFNEINMTLNRNSNLTYGQQQYINLHQQQIGKRRSDQRYQQNSGADQDYSMEINQDQNQMELNEQLIQRAKSTNDITKQFVKSSMADLAKKRLERQINPSSKYQEPNFFQTISQNQLSIQTPDDLEEKFPLRTFDNRIVLREGATSTKSQQSSNNPIQFAFQLYQDLQSQNLAYQNQQSQTSLTKNLHISPKFTNNDESFIPSQLNRELLNEMAANYQMLELTPDQDYQMLLNNKSVFQRQESSIYSNNLYAEPIEMALSPRNNNVEVSIINPQNLTTNNSQLNCQDYGLETEGQQHEDYDQQDQQSYFQNEYQQVVCNHYDQEVNQAADDNNDGMGNMEYYDMLNERLSRPYDFELSSNSKYKIISENEEAKQLLTTESAQPSIMMPVSQNNSSICKKLSFGYNMSKKSNQAEGRHKQKKSTLIVSGGEQTINFNLTQEDEDNQHEQMINQDAHQNQEFSDEELDVCEEIPTEKAQKLLYAIPQSRIPQQEFQVDKFNQTQGSIEFQNYTRHNNQGLDSSSQQSYPQTHREYQAQSKRGQFDTQGFIQNNIQKLREILKASPRYKINQFDQNYQEELTQRVSSTNLSARNATAVSQMLYTQREQLPLAQVQNFTTADNTDPMNRFLEQRNSQASLNSAYQKQFQTQNNQTYQQSFIRNQKINQEDKSYSSQRVNSQNPQKGKYLTKSRGLSKENQTRQQPNNTQSNKQINRNILESRKQSIPVQNVNSQNLSHQNSQQSLNIKKSSTSRKTGSGGGYQPITFRAPINSTQHQQNQNFLGSASSQSSSQSLQQLNYNTQAQAASVINSYYNSLQNNGNPTETSIGLPNKFNATGGSQKNISLNNSSNQQSKLHSTGNSQQRSGIGLGIAYLNQNLNSVLPSEFQLQERRVSHQEATLNTSHAMNSNKGNTSGITSSSHRDSQSSLTARSRNQNLAEQSSSLQTMRSKVIGPSQNSQNELTVQPQNFTYRRRN